MESYIHNAMENLLNPSQETQIRDDMETAEKAMLTRRDVPIREGRG
jgi:hypothetical protein